MKTVITEGPKANAASVDGTMDPTVRPRAEEVKDSIVTTPRNWTNLIEREKTSHEVIYK